MKRFDWAGLMEAARRAGLFPAEFWQLTPAELAFLLGRAQTGRPLSRARLNELASAFPDAVMEGDDGRDRDVRGPGRGA